MSDTRQRIVNAAMGGVRTEPQWDYAQVRPIPYATFDRIMGGSRERIRTDCSGYATMCYKRAGAPDPNGLNYNGQGFTGTMLDHLKPISVFRAQKGDLAVLGSAPGDHVVILLEDGKNGDPLCASHGKQGDPHVSRLSTFLGIGPLTVLRGVPAIPIKRPHLKPKIRVSGDRGQTIGQVHSTRLLWQIRHHMLCRGQREHLHFDRIHPHPTGSTNKGVSP